MPLESRHYLCRIWRHKSNFSLRPRLQDNCVCWCWSVLLRQVTHTANLTRESYHYFLCFIFWLIIINLMAEWSSRKNEFCVWFMDCKWMALAKGSQPFQPCTWPQHECDDLFARNTLGLRMWPIRTDDEDKEIHCSARTNNENRMIIKTIASSPKELSHVCSSCTSCRRHDIGTAERTDWSNWCMLNVVC